MAADFFPNMSPIGGLVRPPKKSPKKKPPVVGGLINPPDGMPTSTPRRKPPVLSGMVNPDMFTQKEPLSPEDLKKARQVFLALLEGMSKADIKKAIAEKNASEAYK